METKFNFDMQLFADPNGNANTYSLVDVAAYKDPSGRIGKIAEIMTQANPILDHMPWIEGNLETGERLIRRKSLGRPSWRRINEAVAPSTTRASQYDELTGMLEDYSEVDKKLAETSGDVAAFQLRQATGKIEGMGQEVAGTLMYGNVFTSPKEFHGLMPRYNKLNSTYGQAQVLNAGGSTAGQTASIMIVGWSPDKVYGIYPKYSMAGLQFENLGLETKESAEGLMRVYRSHYVWECGLAVADPRYIIRIANIDVPSLAGIGQTGDAAKNLYMNFIDALANIPNPNAVNLKAYAPRKVWAALSKQAALSGNRDNTQSITQVGLVSNIMGVDLHMLDCMLDTEAVVS